MVVVLPSTRMLTFAARRPARTTARSTARMVSLRNTNPPSARGSGWERDRSSDSGSPFAAFPARRPVAFPRRASPLTAAGPSRTCTGFPHRAPCVWRKNLSSRGVDVRRSAPVGAGRPLGRRDLCLSSVPDLGTGLGTWDLVLRKIAHAGEFAARLLLRARTSWPSHSVSRTRPPTSCTSTSSRVVSARLSMS